MNVARQKLQETVLNLDKNMLKQDPFNSNFQEVFPALCKYVNDIKPEELDPNILPEAAIFLDGACKIYISQVDNLHKTTQDCSQKIMRLKNHKVVINKAITVVVGEKLRKLIQTDIKLQQIVTVQLQRLNRADIRRLQRKISSKSVETPNDVDIEKRMDEACSVDHCSSGSGIDSPKDLLLSNEASPENDLTELPIEHENGERQIKSTCNNDVVEPASDVVIDMENTDAALGETALGELVEGVENLTVQVSNFHEASLRENLRRPTDAATLKRKRYMRLSYPRKGTRSSKRLRMSRASDDQSLCQFYKSNRNEPHQGDEAECQFESNNADESGIDFGGEHSQQLNDVCCAMIRSAKEKFQLPLDLEKLKTLNFKQFRRFVLDRQSTIVSVFRDIVLKIRDDHHIWEYCTEQILQIEKAIEQQIRKEEFDIHKYGRSILESVAKSSSEYNDRGALTPFSTISYGDSAYASQSQVSRMIPSEAEISDDEEMELGPEFECGNPSSLNSSFVGASTPIRPQNSLYQERSHWVPMTTAFESVNEINNSEVARTFSALLQQLSSKKLELDFDKVHSQEIEQKMSEMLTEDEMNSLSETNELKVMTSMCSSLTLEEHEDRLQVRLAQVHLEINPDVASGGEDGFVEKDIGQKLSEFVDEPGRCFGGTLHSERKRKFIPKQLRYDEE